MAQKLLLSFVREGKLCVRVYIVEDHDIADIEEHIQHKTII